MFDIRRLNHVLMKKTFNTLTLKQILAQICPEDCSPLLQTVLEIRI